MNNAAIQENAYSLAAALGVDVEQAEELLSASVLVSAPQESPSLILAQQLCELLVRTIHNASTDVNLADANIEVVIGSAIPRSAATKVWVSADTHSASISRQEIARATIASLHPAVSLVVACYVASTVIRLATDDKLPIPNKDPLILDLQALGVTSDLANHEINLGRAYLAGAGAIGNGFLWGLRWFSVSGQLDIVDFDIVKSGNLNRQIWFNESDVSAAKAVRLAANAQPFFPKLILVPRQDRLEDLNEKKSNPRWLNHLIVAVDSRLARRSLQSELPGEVFDASTTDIREIVLHFNKQPNSQACLGCIYSPDDAEIGRTRDIALALGVSVDDVHEGIISRNAAQNIVGRYPARGLTIDSLVGEAYDSLFKSLCAQAALQTSDGRQIFAPFAFVSVLAGVLLAIETVKRLSGQEASFNVWKINPWMPFFSRLQRQTPAKADCSICADPTLRQINQQIWG